MQSCPFCDIDKEQARLVHEGTSVFVVLSNPRLLPGHTLVIPKRHVERPSDLLPEERRELLDTAIQFQERIIERLAAGCDIRQNLRPFLATSRLKVDHVHFHLLPRQPEDLLYQRSMIYEKNLFEDLSAGEAAEMLEQLRLGK